MIRTKKVVVEAEPQILSASAAAAVVKTEMDAIQTGWNVVLVSADSFALRNHGTETPINFIRHRTGADLKLHRVPFWFCDRCPQALSLKLFQIEVVLFKKGKQL